MNFQERVQEELLRQKALGFNEDWDKTNTPFHWASYINRTVTRNLVNLPDNQTDIELFKRDLIKVAALAENAFKNL